MTRGAALVFDGVSRNYGERAALQPTHFTVAPGEFFALLGPSGSGKSTLLGTVAGFVAPSGGRVLIDNADVTALPPHQRNIGMVFQRPNPFPTMSIYDNVIAGLKLGGGRKPKAQMDEVVERSLRGANLWNEVKDRLHLPGSSLSGGQQQRLCIARAIAVSPDVLLMDEPCSALDPISTLAIEDLIGELKQEYTIVIVTHNMQQATRVSDKTAFFNIAGTGKPGKLIEYDTTATIFTNPTVQATEDYVSGKFG